MERVSMALLIGRGSKIGPLLHRQQLGLNENYEIVQVVTHKRKDQDETGQEVDVPGIRLAKSIGIQANYFNLAQMRQIAKRSGDYLEESSLKEDYDQALGLYLIKAKPQLILMSGWDLVLGEKVLDFFPSENPEVYKFINIHPALLPDEPGGQTVHLSIGEEIPVLRGEHDDVINEAIKLRLPALGLTAHIVTKKADEGGYIIKRCEIPLLPNETLESYEERLVPIEGQFLIQVAELLGKGRMRIEGTKISIL